MTAVRSVPFLDLAATHAEVRDELDAAWRRTVDTSAFIGGAAVERFEARWAAYCDTAEAVGVANGTDALELALAGLGIGPGDEVVLPANTFVATAEAVVAVGAVPRFVDVDSDTLLLTADGLAAALTDRTAAVIPVHLYGQPVDMDAIGAVAGRAGLAVIEDAAQAHGATWRGRRVGSLGHVACFSFYPGKNLGALGDGGAVVTDDPALAARMRSIADHGRRAGSKYVHDVAGRNSRLDGLQAALLAIKLERLDGWNERRREAAARTASGLAGLPVAPVHQAAGARSVFHLSVVRSPARDDLLAHLGRRGVGAGIHYPVPCHLQAAFAAWVQDPLPVAEAAAEEILSLPMHPHLSQADVDAVCDAVAAFFEEAGAEEVA